MGVMIRSGTEPEGRRAKAPAFHRPEIDCLRAVAIIPVVLFHANIGFSGGYIGVDVFFVISGFLISNVILEELRNGTFSFLNFWERRARRIAPASILVVLAILAAGYFILLPFDYRSLGKAATFQSAFISNIFRYLDSGYFDGASAEKPLLHMWSLAVEEQFYFLIPALLILVIHQTMFFGIGMLSGTAREENNELYYLPVRLRKNSVYRIIIGRALAYFVIYTFLISVDLVLVPRMFGIPHIGKMGDLYLFFLPFLLATIFFCMTVSVFVRNRETGIVTMVFFSVILLFLSGFAWPESNMPAFWKYFSYIFPSTHGIQGYIRINSMGADLNSVRFEYNFLWILAGLYFLTATFSLRYVNYRNRKLAYRRMVSFRISRGRIAVRKAYLERKEKRNFIN